jgi:membrane-anchored glycerophosphoryl diester phosphodiesterase (GDPDase)
MAGHDFSKSEAIKFGWDTTTGNLGLMVMALVIIAAIGVMPVVASDSWVVMVVAWVFDIVVGMGIVRMTLRFVDGGKGELADLFSAIPLIPKYLIASIVVGIGVSIGFVLLILPGIYLSVRWYMYPWVLVDKEVGPFEALRQSWEMTRGSFWNLFLLGFLLCLINILGAMALLLGLFVTIPLSVVAIGYAYRHLERATTD